MHTGNSFEVLNLLSDVIKTVLAPKGAATELVVTSMKNSPLAAGFHVQAGEASAFVKIFALSDKAGQAFSRERRALEGFSGAQVPRLLLVSEAERMVMMEFISGETLEEVLEQDNLLANADLLGQWLGQLACVAPKKILESDWAAYLENYQSGLAGKVLDQQAAILDSVEFSRVMLSRNDNALSNFILKPNGTLYGLDFENTSFKPEGWDLVMAARALFLRFPEQLPEITAIMLRAYKDANCDSALPDYFDQVMNTVAVANLLAPS